LTLFLRDPPALNRENTHREDTGTCLSDIIGTANGVLYSGINASEDSAIDPGTLPDVFCPDTQTINCSDNLPPVGASSLNTHNYTNMARNMADSSSDSEKLNSILTAVNDLKKTQDDMKRMFESKLDKMKTDLMQNIDSRVSALRDEFSLEIGRENRRVDDILRTVQSLQTKIDNLESQDRPAPENMDTDNGQRYRPSQHDDNDRGIMVSGIPFTEGEELLQKVKDVLVALGNNVSNDVDIKKVARFRAGPNNRPGLVKVTFDTVDEKVIVLRNKMALKDNETYKNVYLKSCKSHAERLIEQNTRAILRQLPQGRRFRITANGRVQERQQQQQDGPR